MSPFLFACNATLPIMLMVAIGYMLKRGGLMSASFATAANKLVFRVFLPVMLFYNVYKIESFSLSDLGYVGYTLAMLLIVFALAILCTCLFTKDRARRGVLVQGIFRSNYALIGIPLAGALFGEEGSIVASLLSACLIPAFNILAVITLSVFRDGGERVRVRHVLADIAKNPLIVGVALGLATLGVRAMLVAWGVSFRLTDILPITKVLDYLSALATPMALLVLGAQFEFSAVRTLRREIVYGTLMRTVCVPLLGVGAACLLFRDTFSGAHFAAIVAAFTTPVAVSSVPMAQEMGGDTTLAGQLVVWTTLAGAASIFLVSFLLRLLGIF